MKSAIHLLKEVLGFVIFKMQNLLYVKRDPMKREIISSISDTGCYVIQNLFTKEECEELIEEFERITSEANRSELGDKDFWQDDLAADTRIYHAENYSKLYLDKLKNEFLNKIKDEYLGINISQTRGDMLLVNKIISLKNNLGSGGGWHRDSRYYRQIKAIIYLTDVETENGPFQYLKYSHRLKNSLVLFLKGLAKRGQFRFTKSEMAKVINKVGEDKVLTLQGSMGTCILADTRGIHRGKPIDNNERIAMTYYFKAAY